MKFISKICIFALFYLMIVPAYAAANQSIDAEFDCGWVKTLKVTNKELLGHMKKVMATGYECFTTGDMSGMSANGMEVVFDFSAEEATVMIDNAREIITFPMRGNGRK